MSDKVFSVAELTSEIRESLEDQFNGIWIEGEISNLRIPSSGHHYFTLKDRDAQLACVLFRGAASKNRIALSDGMQVKAYGNISVYEARGQYQLIAQVVQPKGFGDLQARFEELKRKLDEEGLFDPLQKKAIPKFPTRIGVVTSPTGAAIQDMIQVINRRAPWLKLMIEPVRVQGEGAAEEIAAGVTKLDQADDLPRPDLIIVARGGGSIEDLWAFNEEVVARAIAACSLPVMSGVGHEIDFTIADFVADRREPTPSAAAEKAAPDGEALRRHLGSVLDALNNRTESAWSLHRRHLDGMLRGLSAREPGRKIQSWAQSLDFIGERMEIRIDSGMEIGLSQLAGLGRLLRSIHPEERVDRWSDTLEKVGIRMDRALEIGVQHLEQRLKHSHDLLASLGPEAVLKRGFSMTLNQQGELVMSVEEVDSGDEITTRFSDGEVKSRVN
ncbi:MAG: exodeoxyribonuclease VII large subunit [Verrucomicrobiota bacterium]